MIKAYFKSQILNPSTQFPNIYKAVAVGENGQSKKKKKEKKMIW